jgi:putative NADH-flavin reductase
VETEHFPDAWRAGSRELTGVLDWLRASVSDIDWVFLSPADAIMPGERTGKFRLGGDTIVRDASGKSAISVEDYAVAMLDEAETPKHHRQRFTLAY